MCSLWAFGILCRWSVEVYTSNRTNGHYFQSFSKSKDWSNNILTRLIIFVDVQIKKIVKANKRVVSDVDPNFYLEYTDIRVGLPERTDPDSSAEITPNECRLRDMTYSAPVFVDIEYVRGRQRVGRRSIPIGRMPIMLRSSKCILSNKSEMQMAQLNECPLDPGGYFIVNGTEKVILVQEQLSKNRIIVESDLKKKVVQASVTRSVNINQFRELFLLIPRSSTHERKSKTYVVTKNGRIYLRHNSIMEDMPVVIVLKAMGIQSDHEMLLLVAGTDNVYQDSFSVNFEECSKLGVFTQQQALDYLGTRVRTMRRPMGPGPRKPPGQEALETLATTVLPHVPVEHLNFRPKALYIAVMTRRVLMAMANPQLVDDRDYIGSKRLEL